LLEFALIVSLNEMRAFFKVSKFDSAVSLTPLSFDSAVLHTDTAKFDSAVSMVLDHVQNFNSTNSVVSMTPLSIDSAVSMTPLSFDSVVPLTPLSHDSAASSAIWKLNISANSPPFTKIF
jgi:hypothetical protein